MVLRKPFTFLIKHFKLIHLIMFALMIYITYSTSQIFSFLNEYLSSTLTLITHPVYLSLFKTSIYVSIFILFIMIFIILGLMWFKKKPIKVYLFVIIAFIYAYVVLMISSNMISTLEVSLVEVRTIKLVQDLLFAAVFLEIIAIVFIGIRATGFDIRNFDFKKDLEELEISEADNEEFELDLDVDTDLIKRKINRFLRYFKYIYAENKYVFSIIILLIIAFICGVIYLNMTVYHKTYKQNESFKTTEFIINIKSSYVTKYDYRNETIDNDYQFVIVSIDCRTIGKLRKKLNTSKIALNINEHNFYPVEDYSSNFDDLGINYNDNYITNEFSNYTLIYKIPNSYINDKMLIIYHENFLDKIKAKLSPSNLNEEKSKKEFNIGEEITFEDSILKDSNIYISSAEMSKVFKSTYKFCTNNNCIDSYEYVRPNLDTNYDKTLIKITGKFNFDSSLSIKNIKTLYDLIKKFGFITYKIDDKEYEISKELIEVLPVKSSNKNITYIEVPSTLENASEVKLCLKIRNMTYVYKLK